jgi:hypothetical protein
MNMTQLLAPYTPVSLESINLFVSSLVEPSTNIEPTSSILDFINDDDEDEHQHCT